MKIAVIGSISKDRIIIKTMREDYFQVGGGVYYVSLALASMGADVVAMPILAKRDDNLLSALSHHNISIIPQWSSETTSYTNTYPLDSLDVCEKQNTSRAYYFQLDDDVFRILADCAAVHLVPLSSEELIPSQYQTIRSLYKGIISLDGQGLIIGPSLNLSEYLNNNIDIIKADEAEALYITGKGTEELAVRELRSWGISEILITKASRGSIMYNNDEFHPVGAYRPSRIVDATGCGDTYIAGYLYKRLSGLNCVESADYASKIAAKSLEFKGAICGDFRNF